MQMATGVALRKLEWPSLPPVDLATEFHWLIHDDSHQNDVQDQDAEVQDDDNELQLSRPLLSSDLVRSPYRQLLNQPKEKRSPLSPAQRAAKKILKLKLELGCLDGEHELSTHFQEHQQQFLSDFVTSDAELRREFPDRQPRKGTKQASEMVVRAKAAACSFNNPPLAKSTSRGTQPPAKTTRSMPSTSAVSFTPAKKKPPRPESREKRELRELHAKQQRLADWLSGDCSRESRSDITTKTQEYSIEVEARIHDAMESNKDKGLWGDPVASLIAREMTSESVFGGFLPTRRLAFPSSSPPQGSSTTARPLQPDSEPDNLPSEPLEIPKDTSNSLIHERALEIHHEAQQLEFAGDIEDALATLQSGIKQLLFEFQDNQDEIQAQGFDFSQDAHAKATSVQLRYKARHRRRVQRIVVLQHAWRKFQVQKAYLDSKNYKNLNASVVQRCYKARYFQRCRMKAATQIQTCFRVFQEQKMWIYLHRACRLLVNEEREKRKKIQRRQVIRRRLWAKLSAVLKLIWLWKVRFKALQCIQSHWKGSRARLEYDKLLAVKSEAEQLRLARELQFVQPRLENAMTLYYKYLRKAGIGAELVRWQMNKPWLRLRRLRHRVWYTLELKIKVQALFNVLVVSPTTSQLSARRLRVMGHLLDLEATQVDTIQSPMREPSTERLLALYDDLLRPAGAIDNDKDATPVLSSRSKRSRAIEWVRKRRTIASQGTRHLILNLSCTLLLVFWHAVLWPLSYVFMRRSAANKRRALSILELQQRLALTKHLRHTFRHLGSTISSSGNSNQPNFACQYCLEAFATAVMWNLHLRGCKREYSEQLLEWDAVQADIASLSSKAPESRLSLLSTKTPQEYYRGFASFEPESSDFVHRLRREKWWSDRKQALRTLINMAVCCGMSPNTAGTLGPQGDDQQQQVARALVAYLLLPLRPSAELHPLVTPQLHAFVDWSTLSSPSAQWISEQQLFAKLLLAPTSRRPLGLGHFVALATQTMRSWWHRATTRGFLRSSSRKATGSAIVLPEA